MLGGVRRKVIDEAEFALHVTRIAQPSLRGVWRAPENILRGQWPGGEGSASGGPGRGGVRKPSAYLTAQHARRRDRVVWHIIRQWLARPGTRDVSGRIKIGEAVRMVGSGSGRVDATHRNSHETHLAIPIANPRPRADCRLYSFTKGTRPHCSQSTV